jgi:hypothetical protein
MGATGRERQKMKNTTDTGGAVDRRSRVRALTAALSVSIVGLLAGAPGASAHQLEIYKFQKFFTGADATGGAFSGAINGVAINNANGRVYVLDSNAGSLRLSQFNANGEAQLFTGLEGVSAFPAGTSAERNDVVFDNTGHGGGIAVNASNGGKPFAFYREDGTKRLSFGGGGATCGIGFGNDGSLWQGSGQFGYKFDSTTGVEASETYFFEQDPCHMNVDNNGYFWISKTSGIAFAGFWKMGRESEFIKESFTHDAELLQLSTRNTWYSTTDASDNNIFAVERTSGSQSIVTEYSGEGQPMQTFGTAEGGFTGLQNAKAVAVNPTTHDVYVTSTDESPRIDVFHLSESVTVPDATTLAAGHPSGTTATLKGTVNADEVETTDCKFEWGLNTLYGFSAIPCSEGNSFSGSSDQEVTAPVGSLTLGTQYHYRLAVKNSNGHYSYGTDKIFEASTAPTATTLIIDRVNTDGARFNTELNPHGGTTHYHFEYGLEDCTISVCQQIPASDETLGSRLAVAPVSKTSIGLTPDTLYHVRVVAENGAGEAVASNVFRTYPAPPTNDPCGNAQVRQQTGASLLLDCRAYELVSAANAGGYEVESDLVPGQEPFPAYPDATDRVLYGLHFGSIPFIAGSPTNYGLDPYVARRTESGWTTEYVGLPADGMADQEAFGSPLLSSDEGLHDFAFGGSGICEPCFGGEAGINIPLRLNGGAATPGMLGSFSPFEPAPSGHVVKYLSADGSHLVFGSTQQFETAGEEGALTIYQRDLKGGTTQVVSTDESGNTLSGPGVAELDQSSGGSRVLIGEVLSTDALGNPHYHLYMHIGNSPNSADLTPGATEGVLFDGMTADGSRVFFTTDDELLGGDTDPSGDIYEAQVSPGGAVSLRLISIKSTGTPSNDEGCTPPGTPNSWNSPSGSGKCSAVAFAAGAGLGAGDATFYFVSPEQLEGAEGTPNQPNLYVVKPGGDPEYVATIDTSVGKAPQAPAEHPLEKSTFATAEAAEALTVDQSNGDVYVVQGTKGKLSRFDSSGAAKEFTEGPGMGTNTIAGLTFSTPSGAQVAVDNAGASPFKGDFYVTTSTEVQVFSPTGKELGALNGSGTFKGSFAAPCGVAVDQSNGDLYVSDRTNAVIWRYSPTGSAPITDADYTVTGIGTTGMSPCATAADGNGHVYASGFSEGPVKQFLISSFASGSPPGQAGTLINSSSKALSTDPATHELFVDELSQVGVFNEAGERQSTISGFSGSRGVAVNTNNGHVFVAQGAANKVTEFGYVLPPYHPIDNPGIVHGVNQAGTYSPADFQVTTDGRYAVFTSGQSLTGFENNTHSEIYRYDSETGDVDCASCATTLAAAKFDTFLSPYGLDVTEDGRVFFTSLEGLVLNDSNEKRDAYEWNEGVMSSISTGRSISDSSLLSVSRTGRDALFFTRDQLVPADENGGAVKIYDAREHGGFLTFPSPQACKASDECHGPGTEAPPPPPINTVTGTEEAERPLQTTVTCKKGFVKKHGECVKKKKKKKNHHRKTTRRHG